MSKKNKKTNEEVVEEVQIETLESEVKEAKPEKFMTFLQILAGIFFFVGVFVTVSPYLKAIIFGLAIVILALITVVTLFTLLFVDEFKDIWRFFLNNGDLSLEFFKSGYIFYGLSVVFGLVVLLYFLLNKKIEKRGQKIIFPIIVIVLAILGVVLHYVVFKDYYGPHLL